MPKMKTPVRSPWTKDDIRQLKAYSKARIPVMEGKRDVTAASHYAAIACEPALVHFQGSSSSIFVFG